MWGNGIVTERSKLTEWCLSSETSHVHHEVKTCGQNKNFLEIVHKVLGQFRRKLPDAMNIAQQEFDPLSFCWVEIFGSGEGKNAVSALLPPLKSTRDRSIRMKLFAWFVIVAVAAKKNKCTLTMTYGYQGRCTYFLYDQVTCFLEDESGCKETASVYPPSPCPRRTCEPLDTVKYTKPSSETHKKEVIIQLKLQVMFCS